MSIKQNHDWLRDFHGCDGGDIGSPEKPSVWVCGIEWGGGHTVENLRQIAAEPYTGDTEFGFGDWQECVAYPYNISVCKLLCALNGGQVENYRRFAEEVQPFVHKADSGYFKMNLYPIAFKNTDASLWQQEFSEITGFADKQEYVNFCNKYRFAQMNQWAEQCRPRLIIGFGTSYDKEFNVAFSDGLSGFRQEEIVGKKLKWKRNQNDTLLAVLPFPSGSHGLNSNESLQKFGERLAELLVGRE
ncbi:hypothetical protein [Neisseria cinerea]|uniref:hypothetical protein n=1 Tax=Neisseria cinerea TaxID=483 RepID=UPI0028D3F12F|nr:hypothetical protein [Neisseria cinerea]